MKVQPWSRMTNIPMKMSWMGRDVDEMSREELIEVVRHLGRELDTTRKAAMSVIDMNSKFIGSRRHFS